MREVHRRRGIRKAAVAAIGAMAMLAVGAIAADWPQFRGPTRDGQSTETGLLKSWPEGGPKLLWSAKDVGEGYAQPVVAGGTVYVAGMTDKAGYLSAFALDGKRQWKKTYGPEYTGRYPGARSIPTVHDGRVYVTSGLGVLNCMDAKTGEVKWAVDIFKRFGGRNVRWGFAESSLIDGDRIICTPCGAEATMAALDRKTGKTVWKSEALGDRSGYCSPLLIRRGKTRLIVTMTAVNIIGVNADDGKVLWKVSYRSRYGNHPCTPIYSKGMLYCTSGYGKGGVMLELSADGTSAKQKWAEVKPDCHHGNMVLIDGYLYGTGHANGGKWVCLELASGKVIYETAGTGKGSPAVADGLMYCYTEPGTVALVRPTPKPDGFQVVSSFKITQGRGMHWAHPTIAGGRLYIRHGDAVMAYDIKAK